MLDFPENKFVNCLKTIKYLVDTCFGNKFDSNCYVEFSQSWNELFGKHTVKSHIISTHLEEFIRDHNKSLGIYSEQATESVQCDFKSHWSKFKYDAANKMFPKKVLRFVQSYNTSHI